MKDWEALTIDQLFTLREQMHEVLVVKLKAKQVELERRLQALNQASRLSKVVKPGLVGLLISFGPYDCASHLLPFVSNL